MKKRLAMAAAATATVAVVLGAGTANGADYLYWASDVAPGKTAGSVGRAALDGSGKTETFITLSGMDRANGLVAGDKSLTWVAGQGSPMSLVSADLSGNITRTTALTDSSTNIKQFAAQGSNVYYPALGSRIGRFDGTTVNPTFGSVVFSGGGFPALFQVLTSDSKYMYAADPGGAKIARITLDGATVEENFITGISPAISVNAGAPLAVTGNYIYWATQSGIGRAKIDGTGTPEATWLQTSTSGSVAVAGDYVYWARGTQGAAAIGRIKQDSTDKDETFISGLSGLAKSITVTPGAGSAPAPTPAPAPAPTPTPAASTLKTPTVTTNTPGQNAVVTVAVQLAEKGKYTFIFEKPTSNEMSREQASSNRVAMQKGTRIGKRRLAKTYTAAVVTTTEDNAKLVTRALLRKAQAKKLNLRVVHTATSGTQTASVIKIK